MTIYAKASFSRIVLVAGVPLSSSCSASHAAPAVQEGAANLTLADTARPAVLLHSHEVLERGFDGDFTVQYHEGPKTSLANHFFSHQELSGLLAGQFSPGLSLRIQSTARQSAARGQWSQWEGIWRRPVSVGEERSVRKKVRFIDICIRPSYDAAIESTRIDRMQAPR